MLITIVINLGCQTAGQLLVYFECFFIYRKRPWRPGLLLCKILNNFLANYANYFIIRTIAQNSIIYISLHQSEVAPALSFA